MPLVSSSLPNMINGVSQQPAPIRLETSCKEMINAFPSIVTGLQKRPNTNYIASLNTSVSIPNDAGIHLVQRDATEKYFIVCVNGDLEVYDIDGTKKTVSFPNGKSYLSTSKPNEQLRFLSVGDQMSTTSLGLSGSCLRVGGYFVVLYRIVLYRIVLYLFVL